MLDVYTIVSLNSYPIICYTFVTFDRVRDIGHAVPFRAACSIVWEEERGNLDHVLLQVIHDAHQVGHGVHMYSKSFKIRFIQCVLFH